MYYYLITVNDTSIAVRTRVLFDPYLLHAPSVKTALMHSLSDHLIYAASILLAIYRSTVSHADNPFKIK